MKFYLPVAVALGAALWWRSSFIPHEKVLFSLMLVLPIVLWGINKLDPYGDGY